MNVPFNMKRAFLEYRLPIEKFISQNRVYDEIQNAMDDGNSQVSVYIDHAPDVSSSLLVAYLTYQGYDVRFSIDETMLYIRWVVG